MDYIKPIYDGDLNDDNDSVLETGYYPAISPNKLFDVGKQFPDDASLRRLSRYIRGKYYFEGRQAELVERATSILKDTPHADKLAKLYIACNLVQALTTKPADLMFGEPPTYLSGESDGSPEQERLEYLIEENDLNKVGYDLVVGSGIRGDGWLKVYYGYREDYSELLATGLIKDLSEIGIQPEVIIEPIPANLVFPEVSEKDRKKYKAVNICYVSYVDEVKKETPYLNVERHIPGFIFYEKYRLEEKDVFDQFGANIQLYRIVERVSTGRSSDVQETGLNHIPIIHAPYLSVDDDWQGRNNIEPIESLITAIEDRLVQIDYVLWKHADPTLYGPPINHDDDIRMGGRYMKINPGDVVPGVIQFDSRLDSAFRELDRLIGMVFAISETPQWIFGSTITEIDNGGTGTSHTDGAAIKARFMPILSKVKRIRVNIDKAIRDALWTAMQMERYVREKFETDIPEYEPVYPKIVWKDGLPQNELEEAQIMALRTGNKQTIDTLTAIKYLQNMDTKQAEMIYEAIQEEKKQALEEMKIQPSVDLNWNDNEQQQQDDQQQDNAQQDNGGGQ
ncbi:phage portal protein [Thermoactinomyces daqus]|uniref:Phage portal protein n=1 Tax=Thermoactinomyces daqus TaxID=1329516 RepID=A0A7W1XA78_9BACL|nr:phage portal protein [Thermoactinomyces daqus]MBA4542899.1 phage portal protein [Thermoactinomyces daqus]